MTHNIRPKPPTVKPYALLAMLLTAGISVATGAQEAAPNVDDSPAARIKAAIDRYQVTLRCKALDEQGEIVAIGVRDQDAITWAFKQWGDVSVDLPATPKVE